MQRIFLYRRLGWDVEAFYYINTTMDYMLSAKGLVLDELIDELLVLVLEDRQEISEKIKK